MKPSVWAEGTCFWSQAKPLVPHPEFHDEVKVQHVQFRCTILHRGNRCVPVTSPHKQCLLQCWGSDTGVLILSLARYHLGQLLTSGPYSSILLTPAVTKWPPIAGGVLHWWSYCMCCGSRLQHHNAITGSCLTCLEQIRQQWGETGRGGANSNGMHWILSPLLQPPCPFLLLGLVPAVELVYIQRDLLQSRKREIIPLFPPKLPAPPLQNTVSSF